MARTTRQGRIYLRLERLPSTCRGPGFVQCTSRCADDHVDDDLIDRVEPGELSCVTIEQQVHGVEHRKRVQYSRVESESRASGNTRPCCAPELQVDPHKH